MTQEIFKDVVGYEGLYQVSNLGNVKSLNYNHTGREKILKPKKSRGYLLVELYKGGIKNNAIHRLVAEAFIPNPNKLSDVNHKNEDKTDNRAENLEWMSHKENCNYGARNEKIGKAKSKAVLQYSLGGEFIAEYPSVAEVKRQLGFLITSISDCCTGKNKTSHGFIWRYKE